MSKNRNDKNKIDYILSRLEEADFYALQVMVDGFGHDTSTVACFKTRQDAGNYINSHLGDWWAKRHYEVVPQKWDKEYNEEWD